MSSFGDSLRKQPNFYVRGVQMPPDAIPTPGVVTWGSFKRGLLLMDDVEAMPLDASGDAVDFFVDSKGRLTRYMGVEPWHTLVRQPVAMFEHPSLQGTTELLLMAPPWLGVVRDQAPFWIAGGLPAGGVWAGVNYGDRFVFSNGRDATFARESASNLAPEALVAPPARAMFVLGARLYLVGTYIAGDYQPLGVVWNAANADYRDWEGLGSGGELLISDLGQGDEALAAAAMSFDVAVIACRHSLWIARGTGDLYSPATFEQREKGTGIVLPRTLQAVPGGVLFASGKGIEFFDGNSVTHASGAIDAEILPYMTDAYADVVKAKYDAHRGRYTLLLPNATYILDVAQGGRWYKRSIIARDFAVFPRQLTGPVTVGELDQPIGSYTNRIQDWAGTQSGVQYVFLGELQLGREIDGTMSDWGTVLIVPRWTTVPQDAQTVDTTQMYHGVVLRYQGQGVVTLCMPDHNGYYNIVRQSVDLPFAAMPRAARISFLQAGVRASVQLQIESGDVMIHRIQLLTEPTSEVMKAL